MQITRQADYATRALIEIAHPEMREELECAAGNLRYF